MHFLHIVQKAINQTEMVATSPKESAHHHIITSSHHHIITSDQHISTSAHQHISTSAHQHINNHQIIKSISLTLP